MITATDLVNREVHYCVSTLISEMAGHMSGPIQDQAFYLVCPVDDWEEAAREGGWTPEDEDTPEDFCLGEGLEPYAREVYEHWIVSDWLADLLAEKGEKVDKDFAGLTVWARTTTGQGIASDSVIEAIHAELVA